MSITSLIPLILFSLILPYYAHCSCSSKWTTRVDSDGSTYGYMAIISDLITQFEGSSICRKQGGDLVSIHSAEENDFVGQVAGPLMKLCQDTNACQQRIQHNNSGLLLLDQIYRSFWIGLSRVQFAKPFASPTVHCTWTDSTTCDYGRYDGLPIPNRDVRPWAFGNPSSYDNLPIGEIEGCTHLLIINNLTEWNDISCYALLGGVVCKRNCSAECPHDDNTTTTSAVIKPALQSSTQATTEEDLATSTSASCGNSTNICGVDGWKSKCFKNGKCYSYHTYSVEGSYWKAVAKCRKHGATVCSIESEEENEHVCKHYCGCNGKDVWIDMHRMVTEDGTKIECLDGEDKQCYYETDPTSKNPWAKDCPANASNMDDGNYGKKNCCVISNGKWKDVGCSRPISKVLCKKECVKP